MRTSIAALAAVALGATLAPAAVANAGSTPAARPAAAAAGYTPPPIAWGPCTNQTLVTYGAECGDLVVPLDYADPSGEKITVAVSRIKHTTTRYQGVMLVNPGGPGGSGLVLSVLQKFVAKGKGLSYDWIGFDPRGVGSSKPSLSCDPNYFHGDRTPYRPTPATRDSLVAEYKKYAQDCQDAPGSKLFQHVRTTDNVADMESLRKALGEEKINYYGFSYGTYLGQLYATAYPDRMRRFVWDSSVDPQRAFYKSNQDQDRAFQKTFDIYFAWLAKYRDVYRVGDTYAQVRDTFLATQDKLDAKAAGGVLGGDELLDVFTSAGYYVYEWEAIAQAYSAYLNDKNPQPLIQRYLSANSPGTPGADNGYAVYLGTQCTDAPWPQSQQAIDKDNAILDLNYNYFTWSNAWFNGPCAYWKYDSRPRVNVTGAGVTTPILMIDETYDAATPYAGNLVVRDIFKTASLIEGVNGTTHAGTFSGVRCTDGLVARYLDTGYVPPRKPGTRSDTQCNPVPKPDPTASAQGLRPSASSSAAGSSAGSSDPLPPAVRRALTEATAY